MYVAIGSEALGRQEGAIGVYTAGRVSRTEALVDAVAGAPFLRQNLAARGSLRSPLRLCRDFSRRSESR